MRTHGPMLYAVDIGALMTVAAWIHDVIPTGASLIVIVPTTYYAMLIGERIYTYIRILRDKFKS